MEGAFIVSTIAKETYCHRFRSKPFCGQRRANRDRDSAADNAIGAKIALFNIGNVHGSTATAAISGFLSKNSANILLTSAP